MVRLYHVLIFAVAMQELEGMCCQLWGCVLALPAVLAPAGHRQGKEGTFQLSLFVLQGAAGGETSSLLMCFYSVALTSC